MDEGTVIAAVAAAAGVLRAPLQAVMLDADVPGWVKRRRSLVFSLVIAAGATGAMVLGGEVGTEELVKTFGVAYGLAHAAGYATFHTAKPAIRSLEKKGVGASSSGEDALLPEGDEE